MFQFTHTKAKISAWSLQMYQRSYKPHPLDSKQPLVYEYELKLMIRYRHAMSRWFGECAHTHATCSYTTQRKELFILQEKEHIIIKWKNKRLNCISDPSIIINVQFWLSIISCNNEIPPFLQFYFFKKVSLSVYYPITTKASDLANIVHT